MRNKLLVIMSFIMLIGFITIGFFAFPVGIPLCAVIGLYYGIKNKDKLFVRCSAIALVAGIVFLVYTGCLIQSM
ncbi:MAG: hypothetical protein PUB21_08710 [Bacteroidales bacterium]|nr:hypothetical protein [Bacteroidales bacterium]